MVNEPDIVLCKSLPYPKSTVYNRLDSGFVLVQGLEVLESVRNNQMIVEYQGKVMLREQYDKENIFFKRYVFLPYWGSLCPIFMW